MINDDDATDFITKSTLLIKLLTEGPDLFSPKVSAFVGELLKALLVLAEPSELYFNKKMKVSLTRSRCLYLFFVNKLFHVLLRLFKILVDSYMKHKDDLSQSLHLLLYTITTIIEYSTMNSEETRRHFCIPYRQSQKRLLVWTLFEAFGSVLITIQIPALNVPIFHFTIDKLQSSIISCLSSHETDLRKEITSHYSFKNQSPVRKTLSRFIYNVVLQDESMEKMETAHYENEVLYSRIIQITCLALKSESNSSILSCLRMINKLLHIFEDHPDVHHVVRELVRQVSQRNADYKDYAVSLLQTNDRLITLTVNRKRMRCMEYAIGNDLNVHLQRFDKEKAPATNKELPPPSLSSPQTPSQ